MDKDIEEQKNKDQIVDQVDANEIKQDEAESEQKTQKNEILIGVGIALGSILGVVLLTLLVLVIAGFQCYYVLTSSMSPTINAGQTVLVNTNIDKNNLQVGDIVTFESGSMTVTHRIIEVKEVDGQVMYVQAPDYVYQKEILGKDIQFPANAENAKQLHPDNVKGRVVTINGNPVKLIIMGELIKLFKVPNALNTVKIVLVIAIAGLIVWTIISAIREKKSKHE